TMFANVGLRFGVEVCLNTMPLFNNFGATGVMNLSIFGGMTMVSTSRCKPDIALDLISQHGVTVILGSATIYVDLLEKFDPSRHSMTSARRVLTSGAPASTALIGRFHSLSGVRLIQLYGATETTLAVTGEALVGTTKPGTVGRVFGATSVTILDDD